MASYGADKMGFPATAMEALARAQGFPTGGPRRRREPSGEPGMGFSMQEYEDAIAENAFFDSARRRVAQ